MSKRIDLKKKARQSILNELFFKKFMSQKLAQELLEILICPLCKDKLVYDEQNNELICLNSKLAYPIIDGIPIMLIDEARKL